MTSFLCPLSCSSSTRCLTSHTHPTLWFLFKVYALKMILKANPVSAKQISTHNAVLTH